MLKINKKIIIPLSIFIILIIFTSFIKTKTRLIEKRIILYEKKIINLENNFREIQLDYFYLSSPEYISNKINEFSDQEYLNVKFSQIYFSLNQFIEEQNQSSKTINNEKIKKKKQIF
jgi:hypothetical protein|tara:strand:- start:219 stop:569 length:351 start_codon:yes stop_codon:yes gene_type:complete